MVLRVVREVARARGALPADGCDCTHYCYTPFLYDPLWRAAAARLREAVDGACETVIDAVEVTVVEEVEVEVEVVAVTTIS